MKKYILILFFFALVFFVAHKFNKDQTKSPETSKFWAVQSIDTMKYSRDASTSPMSSDQIDTQVQNIAITGATHVAIDTPYDAEFQPRLKEWVDSARKYHLKVWFRGNWSGWEGWFGYAKDLTRSRHINMTQKFISSNPDLFQDGDIFTACPECENGGAGDPRQTGDVTGYRQFMIDEYKATSDMFRQINKDVISNYDSMNGDVAALVMDYPTTQALGGIVTIDHYVPTPDKLVADIDTIANKSGGKIVLGEFGSPISDVTGNQSEDQQAIWIQNALSKMIGDKNIIGLNYWTNLGSSTSPWNSDGSARKVVSIIKTFYTPNVLMAHIVNNFQNPISGVSVNYLSRSLITGVNGEFQIPYIDKNAKVILTDSNHKKSAIVSDFLDNKGTLIFYNTSLTIGQITQRLLSIFTSL